VALQALCKCGDNILVPAPCDGMYEQIAKQLGVETRIYDVRFNEDQNWTINIQQINNLLDSKTRAIVVNNPNRVAGFLHGEEDLGRLAHFCKERRIPVISDEVLHDTIFQAEWYGKMPKGVLEPRGKFVPFLRIADPAQLVFTLGETSHRLLSPMMRLGWLAMSGSGGALSEGLRSSCMKLARAQLPSDLHYALPTLAQTLDEQYLTAAEKTVANNCRSVSKLIAGVHGIGFQCIVPSAGTSLLVKVDADVFGIENETALANVLLWNEAIGVIPGSVMKAPGFIYLETVPGKVLTSAGYVIRAVLEKMRSKTETKTKEDKDDNELYKGGVFLTSDSI